MTLSDDLAVAATPSEILARTSTPLGRKEIFLRWLIVAIATVCLMTILPRGLVWDEAVSSHFFNAPCHAVDSRDCWQISKTNDRLNFYLHDLPDDVFRGIAIFSALVAIGGFFSARLKPHRFNAGVFACSIGLTAAIVAIVKGMSGHYCPSQLAFYQGVLGEAHPLRHPQPDCYPASHPVSGFALLVFAILPLDRRRRLMGLIGGLSAGAVLGYIQLARGEHFVSHILATLVIAVFVGYSIRAALEFFRRRQAA